MIRLMHPAHGWHVLSPFDDLSKLQEAGWVIEEGAVPQGPPLVQEQPAEPVEKIETQPVKRKPGRPRKNRDDSPADHQ